MRTGWLRRGKVRYIPVDAVDPGNVTGGVSRPHLGAKRDISLLLSKDDLKAERYNAPPTSRPMVRSLVAEGGFHDRPTTGDRSRGGHEAGMRRA